MNKTASNKSKQHVALITGATGFVGSHLVRRLVRDGWQVHIVSRATSILSNTPEFSEIICHVHDGSTESMVFCVAKAKPDVVFHLASLFLSEHEVKDIEPLIASNVLFGSQLLEAMKINEINCIINTGTSWQHYNNEEYNPVCLYAATKQAFEAILEFYVQACGIKAITLKLFDTYGPDDPRPKLFNLLDKAVTSGIPLDMSLGEQLIDLVHIDDVIDAYLIAVKRLLAGEVSKQENYAVSSKNPISLKELVNLYAELTKQTILVNWGARPYRFREVMVPWNCGVKINNWTPRRTLVKSLSSLKSFISQSVKIL
jgi:nucleoside-diphosphate-sugar epimerase